MDESAVHRRRLFQLLHLFLEVPQKWSRRCADTASMRLCQVCGCLCGQVLRVCGAAVVGSLAFLVLHWDHHVAMILQSYFADVTKACVLKELSEFCVAQSSLTEFHLVL